MVRKKILALEKIEISNELNYWVDFERPSTHEEFLDKTPRFCEYLFGEATKNELTIGEFIANKIPQTKTRG